MKKIWFENIFGAKGAENIYKPDLFHDFQLGYHTTDRTILKCILPEALCTAMPVTSTTTFWGTFGRFFGRGLGGLIGPTLYKGEFALYRCMA